MRRYAVLLISASLCAGCQTTQLRNHTVDAASTQTDLEYSEVLRNLAAFKSEPATLPWFSTPAGGSIAVQQGKGGMAGLNWDYTFLGGMGAFVNHLDKKSLSLNASQTDNDTFSTSFVTNPDELMLMRCAYQAACGIADCDCQDRLKEFFRHNPRRLAACAPGWYGSGCWKDVPRGALHVGRHGGSYVWVMPEGMEGLAMFTLAILDIATAQSASLGGSESSDRKAKLDAEIKAAQEKADYLAKLLKELDKASDPVGYRTIQGHLKASLTELDRLYGEGAKHAAGGAAVAGAGTAAGFARPRKPPGGPAIITPSLLPQ